MILDGSGSFDSDGDELNYSWSIVSAPVSNLTIDNVANPVLTLQEEGTYEFSLVVSDGSASSEAESVVITVSSNNVMPVGNITGDSQGVLGDEVALSAETSTDPDGDPLSYSWTFVTTPDGSVLNNTDLAQDVTFSFIPDVIGEYVVELIVNDGQISSESITLSIVIEEPFEFSLEGPVGDLLVGSDVELTVNSNKAVAHYSWSHVTDGISILEATSVSVDESVLNFTIPANQEENIVIKLTAVDVDGYETESTFTVYIKQGTFSKSNKIIEIDTGSLQLNRVTYGELDNAGEFGFITAENTELKSYTKVNGDWESSYITEITKYHNFLYAIELAHMDDDLLQDIVISDGQLGTYWYKNNGDGSFSSDINRVSSNHEGKIIVADLNDDDTNDVVILNAGINFRNGVAHSVFTQNINDGTGAFSSNKNYFIPYTTLMDMGALSNASSRDFLFYESNNDRLGWYAFDDSDNLVLQLTLANDTNIQDIKISDINNDGLNDIVWATYDADDVGYLKRRVALSHGEFSEEEVVLSTEERMYKFETVDLDNDGDLDLITQLRTDLTVNIHLNDNGNFSTQQSLAESDFDWNLQLKDFDGDGFKDLLLTEGGKIVVYKNQSNL